MKHGFSLVELSIVLVILGLLTGGILAGQSLIRASELRAVSTEIQRYQAASNTFRDKYFAVPGDMRNATAFWQRMTGTADCLTNSSAATNAAGSCDGNGDGQIANGSVVSTSTEAYQFWRQLALAGLIEGSYTGLAGPAGIAGQNPIIGTNVPGSKLGRAGYSLWYLGNTADSATFFAYPTMNWLHFGGALGNYMLGDALKAEEAWNIDTKMDDGRPAYGGMIVMASGNANGGTDCSTTSVSSTAQYDLTKTVAACAFMIKLGL
ncbi:MAG: prepilin-type N-terminal cleavage/methylation domain-containing protein [Alphaproteobacteria bacterium]|nr:prepilin-type N-terminal cleavage/methylation domain-containing protein [Alphaproteobacteria bacterium]